MGKTKVERDIKADDIYCLLATKYQDPRQYACACEVQEKTGWAQRRLDFVVVDCFEGNNLEIQAFEVKISKSDFRRELEDASKHNIFFDDIDKYSIVAPDYVLDNMSIIPPKWGVIHVIRNETGELELKTVRKPLALHDEQERMRPVGRKFFASLFRAANTQSHVKSRIYKERAELEDKIRQETEKKLTNGWRLINSYEMDEFKHLREVCAQLGINVHYSGLSDWERKHFQQAKDIVNNLSRLNSGLHDALDRFRFAYKSVKDLMESIGKNGGDPSKALNDVAEKLNSGETNVQEGAGVCQPG